MMYNVGVLHEWSGQQGGCMCEMVQICRFPDLHSFTNPVKLDESLEHVVDSMAATTVVQ